MEYKDKFEYIRDLFAPETEELKHIRELTTDKNDQIYISPEEGKFLQLVIKLANIKTIVEIGTLSGYSAKWMLDALPADGVIHCFERSEDRASIARDNIKDDRFNLHIGMALDTLPSIDNKAPFDMIFIDADKLNYSNYLNWAEKHIRKGGIICAENTLLFGTVYGQETDKRVSPSALKSITEFNKRLADPSKYTSVMLPTEDGFNIAIKNF